ncbi:MAG: PrsW family intramembrane metalloprotease [bacterium]
MNDSLYLILALIIFGVMPCLIWLAIFLRRDIHPESNGMILKVFLWGVLATIPTVLIEMGIAKQFELLNNFLNPTLIGLLKTFIGVALIEELLKYLVVRGKAFNNNEFDEPTDAILYMIIAGLGFAALENVLALFPFMNSFSDVLVVNIFRFIGAIFLHALCSGTIGYFVALSFYETKKRTRHFITGLAIATFLHGLFNFSIIEIEGPLKFIIPLTILIGLGLFVFSRFRKLKKMTSVCKI